MRNPAPTARVLIALALATGCGGRTAAPATPAPTPPPAPTPAPGPAASTAVDTRPLGEDECVRLIHHVVDVGIEAQRRTKKPDEVPTDDQVAQIRTEMVKAMTADCLRLDRASWQCAMQASSDAALAACEQPAAERAP
jgi:hypothetical protein